MARYDPVIIALDLGNNNLKASVMRVINGQVQDAEEYLMPHGYVRLNDTSWQQASQQARLSRGRQRQTAIMQIATHDRENPVAVKVGHGASIDPHNAPLLGSNKYKPYGIDALMLAMLSEIFPISEYPKGHDNILIGYGFPPSEWQHTEQINKLLARQHLITQPTTNNKKPLVNRSFVIRAALAWDEIVGGIVYQMSQSTRRNARGKFATFNEGDRVLAIDAGGRLGAMGWVSIVENGFPDIDYQSFEPIDGGAITVRQVLRETLKSKFPNEFGKLRNADMDEMWLDAILATGETAHKGVKINVRDAVEDAVKTYMNTISEIYANEFGDGVQANSVLLTGGSVKPLNPYIQNVVNHQQVILAAPIDEIVMANLRGGLIITLETLAANNKLPEPFEGVLS